MASKKQIPTPQSFNLPTVGVETHAHLDFPEYSEDLDNVLERASQAGIAWIGQIFLSTAAYHIHRAVLGARQGMFFTLGIHPHEATSVSSSVLRDMARLFAADPGLRAVGEIGLDFHWNRSPRETQIRAFQEQLALAAEMDLPVVIHSREAEQETLDILDKMGFKQRPLLWHCFGGGPALAREALSRGWHVSIPGTVTFAKSTALQQAVTTIPLSRMVLETDCPFLTPHPLRGKRNEPAYLCYTVAAIARLRNEPIQDVWQACAATARRFFSLPETGFDLSARPDA